MSLVTIPEDIEKELSRFAEALRAVVTLEYAYDVVDEMYTNPMRFRDSLYKLSRLARKVLSDIDSKLRERGLKDEDRRVLEYVKERLSWWAENYEKLEDFIRERESLKFEIIKHFATLAISPDKNSARLMEIFGR